MADDAFGASFLGESHHLDRTSGLSASDPTATVSVRVTNER
jgi:hypothetical protein